MIFQLLVSAVILFQAANSYSGGAPGCVFPSSDQMSPPKSGTGGYSISLTDPSNNKKITSFGKNQKVNVVLSGSKAYAGYLVIAKTGSSGSALSFNNIVGSFVAGKDQVALNCGGITQNSNRANNDATTDTFTWQAPSNPSGDVTFYAIVVLDKDNWYGQTNPIYSTLTFNGQLDQKNAASSFVMPLIAAIAVFCSLLYLQ